MLIEVDLPIVSTIAAQMVFQIAAIYGLELHTIERQLEVLSAFGIACLVEQAINIGIDWLKYGIPVNIAISATAKALMIYVIGNTAIQFYQAKVNYKRNPFYNDHIFYKIKQNSQDYLSNYNTEESLMSFIDDKLMTIPNRWESPKPIHPKSTQDKYQNLHEFLKAGEWKDADQETLMIFLRSMELYDQLPLTEAHLRQISQRELRIVNKLWREFSQNKFGLNSQQAVYNKTKDHRKYYTTHEKRIVWEWLFIPHWEEVPTLHSEWISKEEIFCDKLGWNLGSYKPDNFNFSLSAPYGHLPSFTKYVHFQELSKEFFEYFSSCFTKKDC